MTQRLGAQLGKADAGGVRLGEVQNARAFAALPLEQLRQLVGNEGGGESSIRHAGRSDDSYSARSAVTIFQIRFTAEITSAAIRAGMKPLMLRPGTTHATSSMTMAFTTKRKRPRVIRIKGKVMILSARPTVALKIPSSREARIAGPQPVT